MGGLADISDLISSMNQRSDADDIANKVVSGQLPDPPGAPVGSGIMSAWAQQHGTTPLPAGLASLAGNRQATALSQVGQDAISGKVDAPTALQRVNQITGGDPTKLIGMVSQLRAYGLMPQATQQPNPVAAQAPNLASLAPGQTAGGDSNPNAPAPASVSGNMPYPGLRAVANPPQAAPAGLSQPQQIMQAAILNGQNPLEIQSKLSGIAKEQADTSLANANARKSQSETVTNPTGGPISAGQKAEDEEFGKTWDTFSKTGGSDQTRVAMDTINRVQNLLKNGKVTTGGLVQRESFDNEGHPNIWGAALEPSVIAAKNQVDSTIAPLLKPLFGARVTNFEASNMQKSLGIDPMADTQTNIAKLDQLKDKVGSAARDLQASGQYFTKHGTLAGYDGNASITQPNQPAVPAQPNQADEGYRAALMAEAKRRKILGGQ